MAIFAPKVQKKGNLKNGVESGPNSNHANLLQMSVATLPIQAQLEIGQPNDKPASPAGSFEKEAEATADAVQAMPMGKAEGMQMMPEEEEGLRMMPMEEETMQMMPDEEESVQMMPDEEEVQPKLDIQKSSDSSSQVSPAFASQLGSTKGGGQSLPEGVQREIGSKIGTDFSDVKVHNNGQAAEMSIAIGARAFTYGNDIYFNKGEYNPTSQSGKHLLTHELTHTIQQKKNKVSRKLQLTRLRDYSDPAIPGHAPSQLTDDQIRATNEYKSYMDPALVWQWGDHMTAEEALLACRLILRAIREGQSVNWSTGGRIYMKQARDQLGALASAGALEGLLNWGSLTTGDAVYDPASLGTDFGKWLLVPGAPEPTPRGPVDAMNCWEFVMFGAYKGGYISEARMREIYELAAANVRDGTTTYIGDTIESELIRGGEHEFTAGDADSEEPLAGDIVIFNQAAVHVAISLGTTNAAGDHEILSLFTPVNMNSQVERTTIERILIRVSNSTPVKFWSPNWN